MTGYTIIDNNLINDSRFIGAEFQLLCILMSMCFGNKNMCFPSEKLLAQKLHKSVRTVQRYLKHLVQLGILKVKRRGSISNLYILLCKKVQQTAAKVVDKVKNAYKGKKKNVFTDYPQRTYDFAKLEKKLLGLTT